MSIFAILPVKDLKHSKSRLSNALNSEERESLASHLLKRTIRILKSSKCIDDILVISRDRRIHSLSEKENVLFLHEEGIGLNHALEQATRWSINHHVSGILILPLDIPYLSKRDIDSIVKVGEEKEEILVISPDQDMNGTNALFIKPPGILQYQFGVESFRRHWQQAENKHIKSQIYFSTRISFDVDSPSQFQSMVKRGPFRLTLCQRL